MNDKKPNPFHVVDEAQNEQLARLADDLETLIEVHQRLTRAVEKIAHCVCKPVVDLPTGLSINQQGETMITGVPVGGSGTFQESFVPSNAALPAGQVLSVTWTVDDPNVSLAPSADGTSVVASVAATDTAASFNLTATGTSAALPGPITSGPVNVPILPAPPPLPTALAVNQIA